MNFFLKNNKIFLLTMLMLFAEINSSVAQLTNTPYYLQKYWFYRSRLNNDFVKVGLNQGESLVFQERHWQQLGYVQDGSNGNAKLDMKLGDGTSSLGIYIGVLATEYYLLKQNNQSTGRTRYELFCALNAINRMDYYAETVWGNPANLNGYILRDDIPHDFLITNYSHFNYYQGSALPGGQVMGQWGGAIADIEHDGPLNNATDHGFTDNSPVTRTNSTYTNILKDPWDPGNQKGASVSLDNYISLMIGLSLVNQFVDDGTGYYFDYEGSTTTLKQEARNINDRIISYFRSYNWNLKNVATGIDIGENDGGNAGLLSYPVAEAACRIEGHNDFSTNGMIYWPYITGDYGHPRSCNYSSGFKPEEVSFPFWKSWHQQVGTTPDQAAFIANLQAMCKCGWESVQALQTVGQVCHTVQTLVCGVFGWFGAGNQCNSVFGEICDAITNLVPVYQNDSYISIVNVSNAWSMEHAPLLYESLGGNSTGFYQNPIKTYVKSILDAAPCEGPYNYGYEARSDYNWSSDSRIEHPNRRQAWNETGNPEFPGMYNGIDYMLYYNLLKITNPSALPEPYVDLSERYVNNNITGSNFTYYQDPNNGEYNVGAFEFLTADNTINTSNDVEYRAGKQVDLKSGFSVVANSNFHAYVDPFTCNIRGVTPYNIYSRTIDSTKSVSDSGPYGNMGIYSTHQLTDPNISHSIDNATDHSSNYNNYGITQTYSEEKKDNVLHFDKPIINVYPNPNNGSFTLNININKGETIQYKITNELGQDILKEDIIADGSIINKTIKLDNSTKGVYYIVIIDQSGNLFTKSLIIQ